METRILILELIVYYTLIPFLFCYILSNFLYRRNQREKIINEITSKILFDTIMIKLKLMREDLERRKSNLEKQ